jgi:hypothetical protein
MGFAPLYPSYRLAYVADDLDGIGFVNIVGWVERGETHRPAVHLVPYACARRVMGLASLTHPTDLPTWPTISTASASSTS